MTQIFSEPRKTENGMENLHFGCVLIYLDDVIVFSKSYEKHVEDLDCVLKRLLGAGVHLNPKKCFYFRKSVHYLGHIVNEDGIAPDPAKILAI